ncbi:MAG: DUF2608 domain-containing protein [Holosporales bacterium]|jgi:hypothetical protein|nr:DUF2608 domain-containing protein [Holosporales bacterium]
MIKTFLLWCFIALKLNIGADNWHDVEDIILKATNNLENTLICVDVDNVLTYTNHPCTYSHNFKAHYNVLKDKTTQEIDNAWGEVFMQNPQAILDSYAKPTIQKLQNLGGQVVGLTSLAAGKDYTIIHKRNSDMENIFGIKPIDAEKFTDPNLGIFAGSCLTTDGTKSKGLLLRKFLPLMKKPVEVVVFIDDSEKNLDDVREHLPKNYKYIAIHYTGYQTQIPPTKVSRDQFIAFWSEYLPSLSANYEENKTTKSE